MYNYLGIPYKKGGNTLDGLNCYGLLQLYYKTEKNITLPSYEEDHIIYQMVVEDKKMVEPIIKPEPDCIVLFKLRSYLYHVGIVLPDCRTFLHIMEKRNVCREKLDHVYWKDRIEGYYRWIV